VLCRWLAAVCYCCGTSVCMLLLMIYLGGGGALRMVSALV
jgi:hypothetical protein